MPVTLDMPRTKHNLLCTLLSRNYFETWITEKWRTKPFENSWPEIPDIATAHARGYLTIWPPHSQRKCMAEIKQNKIEHVLAYREQVPRSGTVLESFLGYSDKLVFINKCHWPCFSSMFIFEAWPIQCSTKQRLEIPFLHPKQILRQDFHITPYINYAYGSLFNKTIAETMELFGFKKLAKWRKASS